MNSLKVFENIRSATYTHLEEDASYCVSRDGETLHIYFEWSNGKTDWKNNFDFPAKPYRDMKNKWFAHRGFLKVWKVIEPHLQAEICNPDVKHIIIGGYSHGAAIALLCHEYCKFNRSDISIEGYGFGCPRVVWGFLRKAVKQRFDGFTVVRNGCDLVTHVPPAIFGFRHVGEMLKIGKGKGYKAIESHYAEKYSIELKELCQNGFEKVH